MQFAIGFYAMLVIGALGVIISQKYKDMLIGGIIKTVATSMILVMALVAPADTIGMKILIVMSTLFLIIGDAAYNAIIPNIKDTTYVDFATFGSFVGYGMAYTLVIGDVIRATSQSYFSIKAIIVICSAILVWAVQACIISHRDFKPTMTKLAQQYLAVITLMVAASIMSGNIYLIIGASLIYISDVISTQYKYGELMTLSNDAAEISICLPYYIGIGIFYSVIVL